MPKHTTTPDAMRLLHEGYLALSEVEGHGVRIDKDYLDRTMTEITQRIKANEADLRADPIYRTWQRRYGSRANVGSHEQLGRVIFGELGYKTARKTESGDRDAADEEAFKDVDVPFVKLWFATQKLRKVHGTYLTGIQREMVQHDDGLWYVHPIYNGNTVASYRSSCKDPNFQNNPVRNPEQGEIVRRCYIPRPGHQLVELDYGQIEVRIPCCYHSDPNLMKYVFDPTTDMHRDMAVQIFKLTPKQVSKEARHVAKNEFVFPTFYGSYYAQCAPHIWDTIDRRQLKVEGMNTLLRDHLAAKGITELGDCNPRQDPIKGTFEYHLKEIEDDFWGRRFPVYADWKKDWYAQYQRDGGFKMLTGFAVNIPLDKKQVCNYPVQGVAFHVTLWSLIKINRCLKRYKFKSRVIGEVHDCINQDCHPRERDDVIDLSVRIMTEEIKAWAQWLNVPLVVEPECCPVDASWFDKMAMVAKNGIWVPSSLEKWEAKFGPWSKQCEMAG